MAVGQILRWLALFSAHPMRLFRQGGRTNPSGAKYPIRVCPLETSFIRFHHAPCMLALFLFIHHMRDFFALANIAAMHHFEITAHQRQRQRMSAKIVCGFFAFLVGSIHAEMFKIFRACFVGKCFKVSSLMAVLPMKSFKSSTASRVVMTTNPGFCRANSRRNATSAGL